MYHDDLSDDDDIWRQTSSIYARENAIINKFLHCSNEVKIQSFMTHICNLYTNQLWCEYKASTMHLLNISHNNTLKKSSVLIEDVMCQLNWRGERSNSFKKLYNIIFKVNK